MHTTAYIPLYVHWFIHIDLIKRVYFKIDLFNSIHNHVYYLYHIMTRLAII